MALDKAGMKTALQTAFENLADGGVTAADAATAISNAIDTYVKTALAKVVIPPGTVVIACGMAPVLNTVPISVTGDPDGAGPLKGGLS